MTREPEESRAAPRQHLIRRLVELLERTFSTEGHQAALRTVTELLERLDDEALRAYAYRHGIRGEDELEGEGPSQGQ